VISSQGSTSTTIAGGYQLITNIDSNQEALAALNYARLASGNFLSSARLIEAASQVVNGINYQFVFEIDYAGVKVQYVMVVYKPFNGGYEITRGDYLNLTKPDVKQFKRAEKANLKNILFLDKIDGNVKSKLKDFLPSSAEIDSAEFYGPYHILKYTVDPNTNLKV